MCSNSKGESVARVVKSVEVSIISQMLGVFFFFFLPFLSNLRVLSVIFPKEKK